MKKLVFIFAAIALTACGFSPVYGSYQGSSNIAIDEIPGRSGHELRKALIQELGAGLPNIESAVLNVDLDEKLSRISLRPDAAASRTDIKASGKYVLVYGDTTLSGQVRSETSYNVPPEPYGDIAAQVDASKRAMRKLATAIVDDIRLQLAADK